jgi:hypothetical protein
LYDSYWSGGYLKSTEFQKQLDGKSDKYIEMMHKIWSSPAKLQKKRMELIEALKKIHESDKIFVLVPENLSPLIIRVREAFKNIKNPEQSAPGNAERSRRS